MIIVGERINSTRPKIQEAVRSRNSSFILKEALSQVKSGANFIDINCAVTSGDEAQDIDWVVSVIQSGIKDVSICIDSPNYLAIDRALKVYKAEGDVMINSITAEEPRLKNILPLAVKYGVKVVALTMGDKGMPHDAASRFAMAKYIFDRAVREGMKAQDLYFDPLIRPISTEPAQASEFLSSIASIKALGPVRTICGLSNVSFGLPNRSLINSAFLAMAIQSGLDAVILDPLDRHVMSSLRASQALLGLDEYCANYIKAFREGRLI